MNGICADGYCSNNGRGGAGEHAVEPFGAFIDVFGSMNGAPSKTRFYVRVTVNGLAFEDGQVFVFFEVDGVTTCVPLVGMNFQEGGTQELPREIYDFCKKNGVDPFEGWHS